MKVISVNVGLPRQIEWNGKTVQTAIFKEPVQGPVTVKTLNLEGDAQADLSVHGGVTKAVYIYPSEHYSFWRRELSLDQLPWGMFGENLTTDGLMEDHVYIGDEFRIGTARVAVTEPRMPCYKLGIRFGRADMVKRFLRSERTGCYVRVLEEGLVEAGDRITPLKRHPKRVPVKDITRLYTSERQNIELLTRAIGVDALGESWRGYFRHQLEKLQQ